MSFVTTRVLAGLAPSPNFLLSLLGAHRPYTDEQPQLGVVERRSTAFLYLYLKHRPRARARMTVAGNVRGVATLIAG